MQITDENYEIMSENQNNEIRNDLIEESIENIRRQISVIALFENPEDEIAKFITGYLNYPYIDKLETLEIYADENMNDDNREDLGKYCNKLNQLFDSYWGMRLLDGDIYLYYCLYTVLLTKFKDYFIYFVNGLQKLDEDYVEDLPNYQEFTFKYFANKIKKITSEDINDNDAIKYSLMKEYIDYIIELGIKPELYFQIALMESEGNVILSSLFVETANDRIVFDPEFFKVKLTKLFELPEASSIIVDLVNHI